MHPSTSPSFAERLAADGDAFTRTHLTTVQVNLGKVCNQTCRHCHVDASPFRTESMSAQTADEVLAFLARSGATTLDITGGAPELNPHFRRLVQGARALGAHVIDRCNLTILFEPGQEDLATFLADHDVEIVASLPCYLEDNVDTQRGDGTYARSIAALQWLNRLGYGQPDSARRLNLVYNPVGAHLPPPQPALQADYQRELAARHGVVFHELFTITNMPIARFAGDLRRQGKLDAYLHTLRTRHRPENTATVMCRSQVSLGWDGRVYDCDFHQMLDLALGDATPLHVRDLTRDHLVGRHIVAADHCYGCTAGAGSSCGGALA